MQLEDYFDFLEHPYAIRIKGRRIGLEHIIERYKDGQSPEEIANYFGDLPRESVYAAITYYLHNRQEIDEYLAEIDRLTAEQVQLAEANPSPASLRMRALFKQLREQQPDEGPLSSR